MKNNEMKATFNVPPIVVETLIAEAFAGFCGGKIDPNNVTVNFNVSIETHGCGADRHDVAVFNGCEVVCITTLSKEDNNADQRCKARKEDVSDGNANKINDSICDRLDDNDCMVHRLQCRISRQME